MIRHSQSTNPYNPTKDEKFIEYFLENEGIKFMPQVRINNLKGDEKYAYRDVDFYLPRLKIYVEYYGWYNKSKINRSEYDLKTNVYINNSIPTVIIYPHELGYLDYAFHVKLLKLMRIPKFKNSLALFRYKVSRYLYNGKGYFFFLSLLSFIIGAAALMQSTHNGGFFFIIYVLGFSIGVGLFVHFLRNLYLIFFKDY
ncbi:hypothetical protein [Thalassobellus suaedae]|uniref:Uncharacterized protein n=1 Tax=Thalassobellus suaedae TaxID=3074124 RepID=A0ABY9Y7T3_9FLAO|nr:hypothetical protein RHP49_06315 [Flavobacteriaceae bacterium HL-DH10]